MIILDTNVLLEPTRSNPSAKVLAWLAARRPTDVFATSVTEAEIFAGIELLPQGRRRVDLETATQRMFAESFNGRVLPFDGRAAREYAIIFAVRTKQGRSPKPLDTQIAAIARSCGASLATRNARDFQHCGIQVINPWTA